jgi:hypothetical protein
MELRTPCEYCGADLPPTTDKRSRKIRGAHFQSCPVRIAQMPLDEWVSPIQVGGDIRERLPLDDEQKRDLRLYGSCFTKDGKRIDPKYVCITPHTPIAAPQTQEAVARFEYLGERSFAFFWKIDPPPSISADLYLHPDPSIAPTECIACSDSIKDGTDWKTRAEKAEALFLSYEGYWLEQKKRAERAEAALKRITEGVYEDEDWLRAIAYEALVDSFFATRAALAQEKP